METVNSYEKDPIHRSTGENFSAESLEGVYKRHLQGAWVRSGASVFMWFYSLIAYNLRTFDSFAFTGVSSTVLYLILINPPTLWILKRIRQKKIVATLSLTIHGLEILGYTAIIYFAGGMGRAYLTLLYPALITYVGVMSPRHWPFIVTACCSLSLSGVIALEYFKLIPDTSLPFRYPIPYFRQFFEVGIMTGGFLVVAFISSYTSGLLRRGREKLKKQNADLREAGDKLEQARHILAEKNLALERAMEKAQDSDRKKSEFLANMSHELRTPLNHIIGFAELVADRAVGPLNATQVEYLNDVLGSSRHLLSLINDILDLSKVEAGKMNLEASEIPLERVLQDSLTMVKEKALKHRITLTPRFQEIPAAILADERKLKQILYNLLSNAVKFTPDGGRVELEARGMDGQGVEIVVSDNGIGLKESDLKRIFHPFEQVDGSAGRRYQGTGLGLSLTKRMVELHGGRIWAESEGLGRGSRVHIFFPINETMN
jgi:signal transduction histidine kinase